MAVEYCTDLFLQKSIEKMAKHFEVLCQQIAKKPDTIIQQLEVVSAEEKNRLET